MSARRSFALAATASAVLVLLGACTPVGQVSVADAHPTVGSAVVAKAKPRAAHLPPCRFEDDMKPCFWDAAKRGNREGFSFIIYRETQWIDVNDGFVADGGKYLFLRGAVYRPCKNDAEPGPCWIKKGRFGYDVDTAISGDDVIWQRGE